MSADVLWTSLILRKVTHKIKPGRQETFIFQLICLFVVSEINIITNRSVLKCIWQNYSCNSQERKLHYQILALY